MAADDLDRAQVETRMRALADHLESELPDGTGVMVWFYKRKDPADIIFAASHDDDRETLRVLWSSIGRLLVRQEIKERDSSRTHRSFIAPGSSPRVPRDQFLVSSATVDRIGGHERVRVWCRGSLAGELLVKIGDGDNIAIALGLEEVFEFPDLTT